MPSFDFYESIDVDEFLSACSRREINEVIESLVEDGYIPSSSINVPKLGRLESDFSVKLDKLKEKYYSLTEEEERQLNSIFDKYL